MGSNSANAEAAPKTKINKVKTVNILTWRVRVALIKASRQKPIRKIAAMEETNKYFSGYLKKSKNGVQR